MSTAQATADVLWTTFMAMRAEERRAFLERLIGDPRLREDLLDAAAIEERRHEPSRPMDDILADIEAEEAGRAS